VNVGQRRVGVWRTAERSWRGRTAFTGANEETRRFWFEAHTPIRIESKDPR